MLGHVSRIKNFARRILLKRYLIGAVEIFYVDTFSKIIQVHVASNKQYTEGKDKWLTHIRTSYASQRWLAYSVHDTSDHGNSPLHISASNQYNYTKFLYNMHNDVKKNWHHCFCICILCTGTISTKSTTPLFFPTFFK